MNPRRIAILVAAIVIAGVAAAGLIGYVRSVENTALDDAEAAQVWIVKEPIQRGMSASDALTQGLIVQEPFPAQYRPANAIEDPQTELTGLVAVNDLPVNEIVKTGTFVAPNVLTTGITDRLEERGMVTFTMQLPEVKAVAFQIEPGDHVNIVLDRPYAADEEGAEGPPEGTEDNGLTDPSPLAGPQNLYPRMSRYVYQKAEVLSIGKALTPDLGATPSEGDPAAAPPVTGGMITLAVPPDVVQTLLSLGPENYYLSLVPQNYEPEALPPIELNPVLPAEDEGRLTPYGPPEEEGSQ